MLTTWAINQWARRAAPPVALAVSDFKNDAYSIGGVNKIRTDLWTTLAEWGAHNNASFVAGVGWSVTSAGARINDAIVTTAGLFSALNLADGVTVVADYSLAAGVNNDFEIAFNKVGGPNFLWDGQGGNPNTFAYGAGDDIAELGPVSGHHRIAFLFTPDTIGISRDGEASVTVIGSDSSICDYIGMNVTVQPGAGGTVVLEKITFYPKVHAVQLPGLSA